ALTEALIKLRQRVEVVPKLVCLAANLNGHIAPVFVSHRIPPLNDGGAAPWPPPCRLRYGVTGVCSPVGLSVTLRTRPPSNSAVIWAFVTTASNCSGRVNAGWSTWKVSVCRTDERSVWWVGSS